SASKRLLDEELRTRVREALEALPPLDREVLILRYLERLSPSETAEALGISKGAASTRHTRALARLRELLDVDHGEERRCKRHRAAPPRAARRTPAPTPWSRNSPTGFRPGSRSISIPPGSAIRSRPRSSTSSSRRWRSWPTWAGRSTRPPGPPVLTRVMARQ